MSEEEKKAIELLKQEPDYSLSYYKRENAIDIVLKLIEKQQKEIEDLKDFISKLQATKDRLDAYDKENTFKIEKQQKEIEALEIIHNTYKEMIEENNYISKDKIKELLHSYSVTDERFMQYLNKLLEE